MAHLGRVVTAPTPLTSAACDAMRPHLCVVAREALDHVVDAGAARTLVCLWRWAVVRSVSVDQPAYRRSAARQLAEVAALAIEGRL